MAKWLSEMRWMVEEDKGGERVMDAVRQATEIEHELDKRHRLERQETPD